MVNYTIKDMEQKLLTKVSTRAAKDKRSVNKEIQYLLETAINDEKNVIVHRE